MKLIFSLSEATETIRHNKMRTILTMLGMNIGVGAIIAIISIGLMARTSIMEGVGELGAALVVVQPEWRSYDDGENPVRLAPEDAAALQNLLTDAAVLPYLRGQEGVSAEGVSAPGEVIGIGAAYNQVWSRQLESGRFLESGDHRFRRKAAVLGSRTARKYFGSDDPVGESLRVGNQVYTVVGVLAERGRETMSDGSDDATIFVPLETYLGFFDHSWYGRPYLNYAILKIENMARLDQMVSAAEVYLFSKYGLKGGAPVPGIQGAG